jgi:hypothetical protein
MESFKKRREVTKGLKLNLEPELNPKTPNSYSPRFPKIQTPNKTSIMPRITSSQNFTQYTSKVEKLPTKILNPRQYLQSFKESAIRAQTRTNESLDECETDLCHELMFRF